jgi:hypothetical protein
VNFTPPRYLAELSKFRLAPPGSALLRLKALLDDFNGANIDAACALVEGAGRFFTRLPGAGGRVRWGPVRVGQVAAAAAAAAMKQPPPRLPTSTLAPPTPNPQPPTANPQPPTPTPQPQPPTPSAKESRVRMDNLLGVMMRLRNARNLDSRHAALVDGAYWVCRRVRGRGKGRGPGLEGRGARGSGPTGVGGPAGSGPVGAGARSPSPRFPPPSCGRPPDGAGKRRRRPALQEYIRHLIFERLGQGGAARGGWGGDGGGGGGA